MLKSKPQIYLFYRFYYIYWTIVSSVQLSVLIIALIPSTTVSCDHFLFSYHFFAILGLDIFQCFLIMIGGMFIKKSIQLRPKANLTDSIALREMDNVDKCLK
jgi:hypothetical protein